MSSPGVPALASELPPDPLPGTAEVIAKAELPVRTGEEATTTFPVAHLPVDIRSFALMFIAMVAGVYLLHWASAVFIPLLLGLLMSYALSPVVDFLQRWHVPRVLGAAALLLGIVFGLGATAYSLSGDTSRLIEALPLAVQKMKEVAETRTGDKKSALQTVQKAADQLEQVANGGRADGSRNVSRVRIEGSRFSFKDYLWTGTVGLASLLGQGLLVLFMTFFLLVAGDTFRRKLVRVAGPTLAKRKVTVQALNEITQQIQRFLLMHVFISALAGVATGLAFWAMGLENAAVWGIIGAVFRLVPYVGSAAAAAGASLVAFLQFGTADMALLVAGTSLLIHSIAGTLVTPWLTSRASSLNPVAIFVGVIAFGWLWGVWGLLLGVPLLMVVKAVCDRVDDLKPIGEFLGA
ncbi:AI-2E family transporter [Rhodoferax koreense]|uniref:AI-2E family transporter n=1 Tax=Rhodoferax koreensis TaxID=1842727 RepID=UPI0009FA9449|nr:AI-2E family transporter [Rhodoferax koreense]